MKEFSVIFNSLTREGQEKLANTLIEFIDGSDIVDRLYKEAAGSESQNEYRSVLPKAVSRYGAGYIAGSALLPIAVLAANAIGKRNINPSVRSTLQNILTEIASPNNVGMIASVPAMLDDVSHNAKLKNEDRKKMYELFNKSASETIDELFKMAKMDVPTPQEAKKEMEPKKQSDDRPIIKCEVCGYKGRTTPKGECPECGAIMGVKPSQYPVPYTPIWTGEPMSGISVNEASIRGKIEEAW